MLAYTPPTITTSRSRFIIPASNLKVQEKTVILGGLGVGALQGCRQGGGSRGFGFLEGPLSEQDAR